MFTKIIEKTGVDNLLLDRCLWLTFTMLSYKKYGRADHLKIETISLKSVLHITDIRSGNRVRLLEFGRPAIKAAVQQLYAWIKVAKYLPEQFKKMVALAENGQFEEVFILNRAINHSALKKFSFENDEPCFNKDVYEEDDDIEIYEDGPYCGACESAPCICSDPERSSTTWNL